MKWIIVFTLLFATVLQAKSNLEPKPQGIALVLAGGGAKGLAHIGVLKALEEEGVRISGIAGTSMGALMAGLYACGYTADQLDSLANIMDWNRLFSSAPETRLTFLPDRIRGRQDIVSLSLRGLRPSLPSSAVSNMRVGFLLSGMTGPVQVMKGFSFDSLRIPLRIVAADLISRNRVIFSNGTLYERQLASMAIPGVFPPVKDDSLLLVDGGILDNMPVDAAVKTWQQLPVLAVALDSAGSVQCPEDPSMLTITGMTFEALSARANEHYFQEPDWLLTLDVHGAEIWSFAKADSLIHWGYQQGKEWLEAHPELPRGITPPTAGWDPPALTVRNILFSGNNTVSIMAIDSWMPLDSGDTLNVHRIMEAGENLYASGLFSMVRMNMLPTGEAGIADLAVHLKEKEPGSIGMGLSYNSGFGLDSRITIQYNNTLNRGIRSLFNAGGGSGYCFLEASGILNDGDSGEYIGLGGSIYQIRGEEPDCQGTRKERIWTDQSLSLTYNRYISWFGFTEFIIGIRGRNYAGSENTEAYPLTGVSFLSDTRYDLGELSSGTRLHLGFEYAPDRHHTHYTLNWDLRRQGSISGPLKMGMYTWGKLIWGNNYRWQESRLTAARGIPGYRWNALPSRERIAGGINFSRNIRGPVFIKIDGVASYDFKAYDLWNDGNLHWGAGLAAGVNIPGGTATLGPGWNDNGNTRWTFSYGSEYSFGPGR